ncbi:unnamed protein product [Pieris macdunnoughi]|uniref:Uncharacterized protein n=1 Tax=Pieris macdunnoughi TaxID=345717 RepID=A0A821S680_9NEOP|nr:unnamed protein product [Pieris macdunnoughi]
MPSSSMLCLVNENLSLSKRFLSCHLPPITGLQLQLVVSHAIQQYSDKPPLPPDISPCAQGFQPTWSIARIVYIVGLDYQLFYFGIYTDYP